MTSIEQRWRDVRDYRDKRLRECDWVALRAFERGEPVPQAWAEYRETLRNIPQANADPFEIVWPRSPK